MKAKRKLKQAIFIACEGKNTERIYFEAIGEDSAVAEQLAVTVYPDEAIENPTTHALGLVQLAQSKLDEFDEVWAVFDKDGYTQHAQTFETANRSVKGKTVNIAFSSIAFEQWILHHFCRSTIPYPKSADIIDQLINKNYFPGYVKTYYQETYAQIKDKTLIALENSAWLRFQLFEHGILPDTPVHDVNPYSDVDVLVKRLLGINQEICWTIEGRTFARETFAFNAVMADAHTTSITFTNNGQQSVVFNAGNLNNHFYLLNAAREEVYFNTTGTVQINPGQSKNFTITSNMPIKGNYFNFLFNNDRIMIEFL